ncbi:protein kinase domain-containing protein [Sorangium sp. So ce1097]|uniref:serine/threonine-protein kinase n=1 Tax=Sorangium sp. So ce1097 TaxID=3133330 RepID=UPI003F5E5A2A
MFLDYRVTEVIDAGGMGEVYKAVEDYSEDVVAIKCMLPRHLRREDFARRFRQECKFYPKLKHPNIVRMRKAGVSPEDVAYIVMDYLEGRTLRKLLNKAYRLDFLSAMHVMLQVADAMTFVHSKGIWHRDLKPENIMVGTKADAKGHVWLLDFGIAKFADGGMSTDDLPDVGTVRYISPEQVKLLYTSSRKAERAERARPDGRTDIYAFGAIFYEVLTGKHLFLDDSESATAEETLTGHLVAAPEPVHEIVPDCPEFVWPVVARCIAIDREERYPRFDDVARDLRGLLRDTVPAGHVLARRLAQEKMKAEREAAFAGVALEDSAPVEEERSAGGRAGEEETERARGRSVEGGMERCDAEGEARARRVVHGETAPLEQFVAPASALPFAPVSRVLRGRGVGHTEPLPALRPLESTAKLSGKWAGQMAQRMGAPPLPQAGAQGVGVAPQQPAEVRAESYAVPPPRAAMEPQHVAPPQPSWREAHRAAAPSRPEVEPSYVTPPYVTAPPFPVMAQQPVASSPYPVTAQQPVAVSSPYPVTGQQPVASSPYPVTGQQPVASSPYPVTGQQPVAVSPYPVTGQQPVAVSPYPVMVQPQVATPPLALMETQRAVSGPLPAAARPVAPSSVTAPSAGTVEALRKETPTTPAPAALLTQPRRRPRAYVLAPLVALALTLGGVGVVLGLRSARDAAPAAMTGEPAATAAPVESATTSAAPPAEAVPVTAPPAEAVPAAPVPEAEASAAEAAAADAAAKGAAAETEAPSPKAQAEAAKELPPAKAEAAKAAAVKAAAETYDDDEDIYPMPKRQKPSFLRVIEERKKAAPAKSAAPAKPSAPAKQQGAQSGGACTTAGCRPF